MLSKNIIMYSIIRRVVFRMYLSLASLNMEMTGTMLLRAKLIHLKRMFLKAPSTASQHGGSSAEERFSSLIP